MSIGQALESLPFQAGLNFLPANTVVPSTLVVAAISSRLIDEIIATNNDTIDHYVDFNINVGGTNFLIGQAKVPLSAGYGGVPAVDLVPLLPLATLLCIPLAANATLLANMDVTISVGKMVSLLCIGGYI